MGSRQRTSLAVGALGLLLLAAAPRPADALALLADPALASDPTAPVVALLSLLAWLLAGWLALAVALTAGSQLPGRGGRVLAATARRTLPPALRRAAAVVLGTTVAVGALSTPATAVPGDLDAAAPVSVPSLDWGAPAPAEAPAHAPVVVRPGDTLWALAAQELATRTGTAPSDAQVAQRWPDWWAANRAAVGDDPHHITPGLHLSAPPA